MDQADTTTAALLKRMRSMTGLPLQECRRLLADMSEVDRSRFFYGPRDPATGLLIDPGEIDSAIAKVIDEADALAELELADSEHNGEMGFCHLFWRTKKRILKERFGIDWNTPAEMNPWVFFD